MVDDTQKAPCINLLRERNPYADINLIESVQIAR